MPHSHLDVGYTHPQPMLLELQKDYLDQALALIEKTKNYPEETQFRWTIEGNYILKNWLETASEEQVEKMKAAIHSGHICVTALPMHTTPGADAREMITMLSGLKELEKRLDTRIHIAISHDVDGQPWTLGQLMLDSGVDFYLTGINVHYGGVPFLRPAFFQWEMSDGRKLPTFLGEHYSLFSQYAFTWENSTARMEEGLSEHAHWLESRGYDKEFMFLSATNPPWQYDNNPPDWNLPDLIQRYNEEKGHSYKIRLVTAEMLRNRLYRELEEKEVPVHAGDWTDFWNFGCASTAVETRVSRLAKGTLSAAEMLECYGLEKDPRYASVKARCQENIMLYDEHTWGASQAISEPDCPETCSQLIYKKRMAYRAADLAGYLTSVGMNRYCKNPAQSDSREGMLYVNPCGAEQTFEAIYNSEYRKEGRVLGAYQTKFSSPYLRRETETESAGILTMKPFSAVTLSFEELDELKKKSASFAEKYDFENGVLETPYYKVQTEEKTGRILQITDKATGRKLLSGRDGFALFDVVREQIDGSRNSVKREILFGDSVELRNHDISQWNHDWKALRTRGESQGFEVEKKEYEISLIRKEKLDGTEGITQKITFYTYRPGIHMETSFIKKPVCDPEALYFVIPVRMPEGWECSYDTAGEIVKLDEEQLGRTCRDYQTVDSGVSLYGENGCLTLCCPDAPMIQVGDFQFAREQASVPREQDPLLLAWPMNNYWSTNFMANQSGSTVFVYELNFHESFSKEQMYADGIRLKQPVVKNVAVQGPFEENVLLKAEGSCQILNVYPDKAHEGMIALVKNQDNKPVICRLTSPTRPVTEAEVLTPAEETVKKLPVENGTVSVEVPARALMMVRLR